MIEKNKIDRYCPQDQSRRDFLKFGMNSFLGLIALRHFQMTAIADQNPVPKAEHCIVMFMNGGPSQLDTFDPKPNTINGGPIKAIKTSVKGIQFAETLPQVADQAHHLTVIRSMLTHEGNHERARYLMHTGYAPTGSIVQHPTFGSIISNYRGEEGFELPNCVNINSPAFNSGFLRAKHDPFVVNNPMKPIDDINYPSQMDSRRFDQRMKMLTDLQSDFLKKRTGRSTEAHEAIYKKANNMINSARKKAFELGEEPIAIREAYGMNRFGQGCLMARRLIENGVKFVEISLDGWDTHDDNFGRVGGLMKIVDPAFAMLIRDLDDRDLLDKTLVLWLGEFGRTPKINKDDGRDHFPNGWSMVLAGGGVRDGQIIGATDENGTKVVDQPVSVQDIFASLCQALRIDHNLENYSRAGRPIRVVDNGRVIKQLFA